MEPFLKWAGGKRWLLSSGVLPEASSFKRFIEPFVGGGAVFFHYLPAVAIISDINEELIELYCVMRDMPGDLQERMRRHQSRHSDVYYYQVRAETPTETLERAARTLYLNRTCWNGLYRVNLLGRFNVPRGTKDTVLFDGENFDTYAVALKAAEIKSSDFEAIIDMSTAGDLVFVDPPYTVKHNVNGFLKYNERLFRWDDQVRLRDAVLRAKNRDVAVIMTNADHESVRELYRDILVYERVSRMSVLAGSVDARVSTSEALFTGGVQSAGSAPTIANLPVAPQGVA